MWKFMCPWLDTRYCITHIDAMMWVLLEVGAPPKCKALIQSIKTITIKTMELLNFSCESSKRARVLEGKGAKGHKC